MASGLWQAANEDSGWGVGARQVGQPRLILAQLGSSWERPACQGPAQPCSIWSDPTRGEPHLEPHMLSWSHGRCCTTTWLCPALRPSQGEGVRGTVSHFRGSGAHVRHDAAAQARGGQQEPQGGAGDMVKCWSNLGCICRRK